MGFFSGVTSAIGSVFKGASSAVKTFGKDAIMKKVMTQFEDIENVWDSTAVEQAILSEI